MTKGGTYKEPRQGSIAPDMQAGFLQDAKTKNYKEWLVGYRQ